MADDGEGKGQPGTPPDGKQPDPTQGMSPPGSQSGASGPTPGPKDEGDDEPTFTKAQVTDLIQREIGKITRKHSKEREALETELNQLKSAKLTEPEKMQAEVARLEKDNTTKEIQLAELTLKLRKREMLEERLAAGKMSIPTGKTMADILKIITGNEEEDIAASLDFIESLFPVKKTSVGGGTKPGSTTTTDKIWTKKEVLDLQKTNPLEYEKHRATIIQQMNEGLIK